MQINVEKLPECLASVRVEIPAEKVTEERKKIAKEFGKQAKLPGYRPGKIPASVIETRFKPNIDEEFENRIIGEAIREAREQEGLDVINVTKVEDKEYNVDGTFSFVAELTLKPEFELPEYKEIPVRVPPVEVTDEDVDGALEQMRENYADYEDITDRGAELGDFIVVDYTGSCDGKPIGEVAPDAPAQIATGEGRWFKLEEEESFVPGFFAGMVGAKFGEARDIEVTLPVDFPDENLAAAELVYRTELKGLKRQVLPEFDDELAEKIRPDTTVDELRELVEADLLRQREGKVEEATTQQIVNHLATNVDFELPKDMVMREAQGRINNIVRQNAERGIGDDTISEHQEEIMEAATRDAHLSVKNTFILEEIAEKEEIKVDNDELRAHVRQMAENYGTTFDKLAKDLEKEGGVERLHHQMLISKTLDFLRSNASVETLSLEELKAAQAAEQG